MKEAREKRIIAPVSKMRLNGKRTRGYTAPPEVTKAEPDLPDLVDEVDEELRAERAARVAQRYGGVALAFALAVVAGIGGYEAWRWNERRQAAAASERFLAAARTTAAEGADLRAAAAQFAAVGREAPAGYATLARLRAAALLAEAGDREAALAGWDALARDSAADPLYRDLATLMWGLHAIDGADPGQIEARLAPLTRDGQPWRATAREIVALAQLRRGSADEARRGLQALASDPATPQGARDRANRLLGGLGG
jgi:hypothetical protein